MTEEDIRNKVVTKWLVGHGINPADLRIEFSFSIRLGRTVLSVEAGEVKRDTKRAKTTAKLLTLNPRADVVVRNHRGQNLLIVEVKAPSEPLDDQGRDQGISYARLLTEGNIAPFVVLTNGFHTKIFDSITKEEINGSKVPVDHPYAKAGFCISSDDLLLRAEALELFVSLSAENLLTFCREQVFYRMSRLRGEELNSGKKYIPSLYIEREEAKLALRELLDKEKRPVAVLFGPPQVGKTNFVCHTVENLLDQEHPCLFYPAIGLQRSLLEEISEDFGWIFNYSDISPSALHQKMRSILYRSGQKLIIFIDGWNETNIKLAQVIDQESERLSCDGIQLVISLTSVAAGRLLRDASGNLSFVADAASITNEGIGLIESGAPASKWPKTWSAVAIDRYTAKEREEAYKRYSEAYEVVVPERHQKIGEPYLLGVAMSLYKNRALPDILNEPAVLEQFIEEKIRRAGRLEDYDIKVMLSKLAEEMLNSGVPVSKERALAVWGIPVVRKVPSELFEAALLAEVRSESDLPSLDFYYGRERDFVIAYWVCQWLSKVQEEISLDEELARSATSSSGLDALRWFFKQPKHLSCLRSNKNALLGCNEAIIKRLLLSGLCDIAARGILTDDFWVEYAVKIAKTDNDKLAKIQAVRLISLAADDKDDLLGVLDNTDSLYDFVEGILSVSEEYPLEKDGVGFVILDSIRSLHWDSCVTEPFEGSSITDVLETLMHHELKTIRQGAAACLGYTAPHLFLQLLADKVASGALYLHSKKLDEYSEGILLAEGELGEAYYGSMCPGYLDSLEGDPELLMEEYIKMKPVLEPVIEVYERSGVVSRLIDLLEALRPQLASSENEGDSFKDIYTLQLPFTDEPNDC